MSSFYNLGKTYEDEKAVLYGRPEWEKKYGRAEWADSVELEKIVCPDYPGHQRPGERLTGLSIILPSPTIGDFAWTWYSDCLITDHVLHLFRQAGLSGFKTRPAEIEKVKRLGKECAASIPRLWELVITGKGADARPESGIQVVYRCEACGMVRYSSYQNGILVNEEQWDGSDFFTVNGYPKFILVTERVKDLIITHQLTNCMLIPAEALRWPEGMTRTEDLFLKKKGDNHTSLGDQ